MIIHQKTRCPRWSYPRVLHIIALVFALELGVCADAPPKHVFLWQVTSDTATVYVLGSIHAARGDLYPLDGRIEQAFEASSVLVVEANIAGPEALAAGMQMLTKAMYPDGDGLDQHISKDLHAQAVERVNNLGLPLDPNRFKPWFLGFTITLAELAKLNFQAQHGIDMYFLKKAAGNKEILELESVDFQVNLFNGFSDKEQELFLKESLHGADKIGKDMKAMVAAWESGNATALENLLTDSVRTMPEVKPVYTKLIDDRNKSMAAKIEDYLKTDKTYFVVVGSAHLVGPDGIVNLLAKKYQVTQK